MRWVFQGKVDQKPGRREKRLYVAYRTKPCKPRELPAKMYA